MFDVFKFLVTMYVNDSSGETELVSENEFPAEHYNVRVYLAESVTPHVLTTDFINEGWPYLTNNNKILLKYNSQLNTRKS